jgi:hypothetical protein
MKALHAFATLFDNKLYDTGYSEVVRESGLSTCTDIADAREAVAYILGAAKMAELTNASIIVSLEMSSRDLEPYYYGENMAKKIYEGFSTLRDLLRVGDYEVVDYREVCENFEALLEQQIKENK